MFIADYSREKLRNSFRDRGSVESYRKEQYTEKLEEFSRHVEEYSKENKENKENSKSKEQVKLGLKIVSSFLEYQCLDSDFVASKEFLAVCMLDALCYKFITEVVSLPSPPSDVVLVIKENECSLSCKLRCSRLVNGQVSNSVISGGIVVFESIPPFFDSANSADCEVYKDLDYIETAHTSRLESISLKSSENAKESDLKQYIKNCKISIEFHVKCYEQALVLLNILEGSAISHFTYTRISIRSIGAYFCGDKKQVKLILDRLALRLPKNMYENVSSWWQGRMCSFRFDFHLVTPPQISYLMMEGIKKKYFYPHKTMLITIKSIDGIKYAVEKYCGEFGEIPNIIASFMGYHRGIAKEQKEADKKVDCRKRGNNLELLYLVLFFLVQSLLCFFLGCWPLMCITIILSVLFLLPIRGFLESYNVLNSITWLLILLLMLVYTLVLLTTITSIIFFTASPLYSLCLVFTIIMTLIIVLTFHFFVPDYHTYKRVLSAAETFLPGVYGAMSLVGISSCILLFSVFPYLLAVVGVIYSAIISIVALISTASFVFQAIKLHKHKEDDDPYSLTSDSWNYKGNVNVLKCPDNIVADYEKQMLKAKLEIEKKDAQQCNNGLVIKHNTSHVKIG